MVIPKATVVLPQDIIGDILLRLPFKSLQRCRFLSKSCNSSISTQSFARMHLKRTLQSAELSSQKILLSHSPSGRLESLDYEKSFSFGDEGISTLDFPAKRSCYNYMDRVVVGSCHGLICLALQNGSDFYLWNPSTGDYYNLPDPSCLQPDKPLSMGDILDYLLPDKPLSMEGILDYQHVYGFGYESFSDDYKVFFGLKTTRMLGVEGTGDSEEKVAIFSTRENCWRIIQKLPSNTLLFNTYARSGSFVNGTLNWLVQEYSKLVAFDLKTERFFELPMPDHKDSYRAGLGILEGRLCLSLAIPSSTSYRVELWVMSENGVGQSCTRLLNSPFLSLSTFALQLPLYLSKDNQIILTTGDQDRLTRVDIGTGKILHEREFARPFTSFCEAVAYLETLVWPCVKSNRVERQKSHGNKLRGRKIRPSVKDTPVESQKGYGRPRKQRKMV